MRTLVREVAVADHVKRYAVRLVRATATPDSGVAPPGVERYVKFGSSPRGIQALMLGGKVLRPRRTVGRTWPARTSATWSCTRACATACCSTSRARPRTWTDDRRDVLDEVLANTEEMAESA